MNKPEDSDQEEKHATDLMQKLTGIAPVDMSYGNQEDAFDASCLMQRQGQIEEISISSEIERVAVSEGDIVVLVSIPAPERSIDLFRPKSTIVCFTILAITVGR